MAQTCFGAALMTTACVRKLADDTVLKMTVNENQIVSQLEAVGDQNHL